MMKKLSRRSFLQATGVLAATAALTACGGKAEADKSSSQNGKIQITFYLWDRSMMKALTPWLEEKFPEYAFTFIQGFNTMDYYRDLLNRAEQLPDIITCRRFSLNDAAPLAEHLMDLSTTEVAGTFYSSYLNNNQEPDGAIRWLPMCAEVDGTAANVDLFAQYNIPLPTNYAEFVAAIDAFEAIGIKGYQADWRYDYTCLETMQGCAIPELMSLEGTTWRMNYESETEDGSTGLDDVVWPKVFEKYEQFLKDVRVQPGDDRLELNPIAKPFYARQTAMIRTTAGIADVMPDQYGFNASILPYFGETANDSWLLTYPMCQAAVSNTVAQDEAKLAAVLKVLEAVYSAEGQSKMAGGAAVLSYNKEINITSSASLEHVADIISANHLYMRLASTEIFRISEDVGHKMITGEYDARAAYDAFNEQLVTPRADPRSRGAVHPEYRILHRHDRPRQRCGFLADERPARHLRCVYCSGLFAAGVHLHLLRRVQQAAAFVGDGRQLRCLAGGIYRCRAAADDGVAGKREGQRCKPHPSPELYARDQRHGIQGDRIRAGQVPSGRAYHQRCTAGRYRHLSRICGGHGCVDRK